jgi:catechol 2,3-dioxygenase
MRLGHVHLKVSDVERSEAFYRDIVGLDVTERVSDHFVFMTFGSAHHDVALQGHPGAPRPSSEALGLYHVAFEVPDEAALGAMIERLEGRGLQFTGIDHGISKSVYLVDPDGHGVEIYCDTRASGRYEWEGASAPLDVEALRRAGGAGG